MIAGGCDVGTAVCLFDKASAISSFFVGDVALACRITKYVASHNNAPSQIFFSSFVVYGASVSHNERRLKGSLGRPFFCPSCW